MSNYESLAWWVENITDRSIRGIALATTALIRSGSIPVGTRLPAVRQLADALQVSPTTISSAWGELRRYKVIEGQGRTGVWVSDDRASLHPQRFEVTSALKSVVADLSYARPDIKLLPDLTNAMKAGTSVQDLNVYARTPIIPSLEEVARTRWPYQPEAMMATNGGFEAIFLALQALVQPGAVVAVEDPCALRTLDILEHIGAQIVPVKTDEEGPVPEILSVVLSKKPVMFVFQPRTHATTGLTVSADRLNKLADLLRNEDILILEDDGLAELSSTPTSSLGTWLPSKTIHTVSYSKSFGPDLRLAILSSTREICERIQSFRNFGARWTSRVLQGALCFLMQDKTATECVEAAKLRYHLRREKLKAALQQRGVQTNSVDGLCLWLPVDSEQFAMLATAARGVAVFPGSRFSIAREGDHIRVCTSHELHDFEAVVDAIAIGCSPP